MVVREITSREESEKLDRIASEYGSLFNRIEWISLFGEKAKIFGIFTGDGELIGGFYGYVKKEFGFSILRNPPLTPEIGPFFRLEAKNPAQILDRTKEVVHAMADYLRTSPFSVVYLYLNRQIKDAQPFIWLKFKVIPGYTYVIDLTLPEEKIWANMSHSRRNDVNRAKRDGVRVEQTTDTNVIKNLALEPFRAQKKSIDVDAIHLVLRNFARDDNSYAFVSYDKNGKPIYSVFCVYDQVAAYALLGGYDRTSKHPGAGAYAIWTAIKHAKELGLKKFDFEGSMVPQIEKFFRGFGGELTPYFTVNRAKLPLELLLKMVRRERF